MERLLFMAKLFNKALQLIIKRVQLDDNERVDIAELHEKWTQKAYGSNEYVWYGYKPNDRAQLWKSTRNVAANAPAPDIPTSPVNWVKVG